MIMSNLLMDVISVHQTCARQTPTLSLFMRLIIILSDIDCPVTEVKRTDHNQINRSNKKLFIK